MRFVEDLLEYENSLGDIFQGQNSFSLGDEIFQAEKKKAVGSYLGWSMTLFCWCVTYYFSTCAGCPQPQHGK